MNINGDLMYRKNIKIIDNDNFAETQFSHKPKIYYIQFTNSKKSETKKVDIFSKNKLDSSISVKYEKDLIIVDINVPIFTIYKHFHYLLAFILKVHIDSLKLNFNSINLYQSTVDLLDSLTFIGLIDYEFTVIPSNKPRINGYDNLSIPFIEKMNELINNSQKDYILNPRITELKYGIFNLSNISKNNIDIVRLMNLNKSNDEFHRIILQSEKMNKFNNESKHGNWFVKSKYNISDPLFGIELIDNSCIFYNNKSISKKFDFIHFSQLILLENGTIIAIFKNLDFNQKYEDLCSIIENWLDKNISNILKEIHIEEVVYNKEFNVNDYKYFPLTLNFNLDVVTKMNITNLNFINNIIGSKQVYSMKSSFRSITNQQFGNSSELLINYMGNFSDSFQATDLSVYFNTVINLNNITNGIYISITNATSFDTFIKFIVMMLNKIEILKSDKNLSTKSAEKIMDYLTSVDQKSRLKQLKETDPVLFSNKKNYGKELTYSQLVQNNQQRPSIVTKEDYDILKKDYNDSSLNIENQTTHERLYLTCPFKDFPIINYHHIKDQGCIVKCTSIISNENQFKYCDSELNGLGNKKSYSNDYNSNALIKFSTTIDPGRRCSLPRELLNLFPKCYLLKLKDDININDYMLMNYNLFPFIIERHDEFYLLPNEYLPGSNFGILFRESIKNGYLLMCELESRKPFIMNDKDENPFIQQVIQASKSRNNYSFLIKYINDIFDLSINETLSIGEVSRELNKHNFSFVSNKEKIIMILNKEKNKLISTPIFENPLIDTIKLEDLTKKMNIFDHLYRIDDLKIKNVSKIFVDLESESAVGVRYFGIDTFIRATKHFKYLSRPLEFIDFQPFKYKVFGIEPQKIDIPVIKNNIIYINKLIKLLISIYIKTFPEKNFIIDKNEFKKFFKDQISDENELVTINNQISWRKSKIKSNLIDKKDFNKISLINLFYENFRESYNVAASPNENQYKINGIENEEK